MNYMHEWISYHILFQYLTGFHEILRPTFYVDISFIYDYLSVHIKLQ